MQIQPYAYGQQHKAIATAMLKKYVNGIVFIVQDRVECVLTKVSEVKDSWGGMESWCSSPHHPSIYIWNSNVLTA